MEKDNDILSKGTEAANLVQSAVNIGKAVSSVSKGAAVGGVYGAAALAIWQNRKLIGKIILAIGLVLLIPILFIIMLPSIIFGDISSDVPSDIMNNNAAIISNLESAQTTVSDCIISAHENILSEVSKKISNLPGGCTGRVVDSFKDNSVIDINLLISQYCASKDNWDEVKTEDLKSTINSNKDKLFSYTLTISTEKSGDKSITVYTYTINYKGGTELSEIFGLDENKSKIASDYAENLVVYLYGNSLLNGTAAVSADVERYSEVILKYAKENGIEGYFEIIKCIMMAESGGRGTDVMQCSECPYNTRYSKAPNSIKDVYYSIEIGIKYFAECLKQASCKNSSDISRISLALQGYNFGNGYIGWALKKYGGYSQSNAKEFSDMMKAKLGWSNYGNPNYVSAVLKYYFDTSISGEGASGWGSPFPGRNWKSAVTSEFGYRTDPVTGKKGTFHAGMDIAFPVGTNISAVREGTVTAVNYYTTGYGYHIIIDHGGGYKTLYGHCSTLLVKEGEKVTKGQVIAKVGSTGKSTGPHLHINVYLNGKTQNPRNYIN